MSPVLALLLASTGVALPLVAGLWAGREEPADHGSLSRSLVLAALVLGAGFMLFVGPTPWVVEGSVPGRALLELTSVGRLVGAGVLVSGAVAVGLERDLESRRLGRLAVCAAGCAGLSLCADLVSLIAVSFLIAIAEAWFCRSSEQPSPVQVLGPMLLAFGSALVYGGLSTTSFAELPGRVSAVFTKWGGAMQFLGPLERKLALPDGARAQFVGDVVTGAAPAMLTLLGMAVLMAGLIVAGRYVAAPGRTQPSGRAVNAMFRLAIVPPFMAVFVRGFGALRLVFEPYGWPAMLVLVLTLGLVSVLADRERPRPTLLEIAGTMMAGCCLLLMSQLAVARPLFEGALNRAGTLAALVALGATGVCIACIVLVHRPAGVGRALAFALLCFAPPCAGSIALLGCVGLAGSGLVSLGAMACVAWTWWLSPSIARANPARQRLPWPVLALLVAMVLAPWTPPVARFLAG